MITTPASDVVLDEVQARKIEVAGHKLSVIETEVVIANRNLRVLKDDIVKATLQYQELEDKLASFEKEVKKSTEQKKVLEEEVADMKVFLQKTTDALDGLKEGRERLERELSAREDKVVADEKALALAVEQHAQEAASLEKKRKEVEEARDAFAIASAKITWQ